MAYSSISPSLQSSHSYTADLIDNLPKDILGLIFKKLTTKEILVLSCLNKRLFQIINCQSFWSLKYQMEFGACAKRVDNWKKEYLRELSYENKPICINHLKNDENCEVFFFKEEIIYVRKKRENHEDSIEFFSPTLYTNIKTKVAKDPVANILFDPIKFNYLVVTQRNRLYCYNKNLSRIFQKVIKGNLSALCFSNGTLTIALNNSVIKFFEFSKKIFQKNISKVHVVDIEKYSQNTLAANKKINVINRIKDLLIILYENNTLQVINWKNKETVFFQKMDIETIHQCFTTEELVHFERESEKISIFSFNTQGLTSFGEFKKLTSFSIDSESRRIAIVTDQTEIEIRNVDTKNIIHKFKAIDPIGRKCKVQDLWIKNNILIIYTVNQTFFVKNLNNKKIIHSGEILAVKNIIFYKHYFIIMRNSPYGEISYYIFKFPQIIK